MSLSSLVRTVRLVSGLVLMAFVAMHLSVLALGLWSMSALIAGIPVLMGPWQSAPGNTVLMASGILHLACGLHSIVSRRSLAMRRGDLVQMTLGLVIMPLLLPHILVVKVAGDFADLQLNFSHMLAFFWHFAPGAAIQQLVVVIAVWAHAAIGLFGWMSLQRWWPRYGALVLPVLFAVPILSLLGFVEAGKEVLARFETDEAFRNGVQTAWGTLGSIQPQLQRIGSVMTMAYAAAIALVLLALALRILQARSSIVHVSYDGGLEGEGRRGLSILEISRLSEVPHASVCSGRGRCGTCRVRVMAGRELLSLMDDVERRTLDERTGSGAVRLACRARVFGDGVEVERLLPPDADASAARRPQDWLRERAPVLAEPIPPADLPPRVAVSGGTPARETAE